MAATTSVPLRNQQSKDDSSLFETSVGVEPIHIFEAMGMDEDILQGIYALWFQKPFAIQQRAVLPIINGRDVIAQAQSGTGKTSCVAIAVCQLVNTKAHALQAVILSSTRELAVQAEKLILAVGKFKNVHVFTYIGGEIIGKDKKKLEQAHVVSGTPGGVVEMINRRMLRAKDIKVLILDDCDKMISKDFEHQIYCIYRRLTRELQVVFISATLPDEILEMTNKLMTDPVRILLKHDVLPLEGIKQYFVAVDKEERKFDALLNIYETLTITQAIIFCNSKRKVDWLTKKLRGDQFTVSSMHGKMPKEKRDAAVVEFRSGATRVLIATDVSAGSIADQQVSLVINYDLPRDCKLYSSRIGGLRCHGCKGAAISLVTKVATKALRRIEKHYSTQIDEMPDNVADLI